MERWHRLFKCVFNDQSLITINYCTASSYGSELYHLKTGKLCVIATSFWNGLHPYCWPIKSIDIMPATTFNANIKVRDLILYHLQFAEMLLLIKHKLCWKKIDLTFIASCHFGEFNEWWLPYWSILSVNRKPRIWKSISQTRHRQDHKCGRCSIHEEWQWQAPNYRAGH